MKYHIATNWNKLFEACQVIHTYIFLFQNLYAGKQFSMTEYINVRLWKKGVIENWPQAKHTDWYSSKKKKRNNSSSLKINLHNFQVIPTDQPQLVFPTTNGPHSDIYLMFWEIKEMEKLMHYLQVASLEPCYNFPLCSPYSIIFQLLFNHRGKLYTLWPNSFRIGHNKWMRGKKHIPRLLL